jgi:transposase
MGWKVEKIAIYLKCSKQAVRETIHRWTNLGLVGLWDAQKSGRKRKWMPEDLAEIESKLDEEPRTYNSYQLCQLLKTEKEISLSERHLRRLLKKKIIDGKERESL